MYTGEIENNDLVTQVKLIHASTLFNIDEISTFCYSHIHQKISIGNVLPILIIANELKIKLVKDICFNFFLKNKTEFIKEIKVDLSNELLFELLQVSTFMEVPKLLDLADIDFLGRNICNHIVKLIGNPIYSDLTIVTVDGQFQVHKLLLSKISSYFYELLTEDENIKEIHLDDFESETLKYMIEFMYKREIEIPSTLKELINVIKFSDKYQIDQLLQCAAKNLQSFLSTENALEIMQCCVDYKIEEELEERCWRIVKSTHVDDISSLIMQRQMEQIEEIIYVRNELENNHLELKEFDYEFDEKTKEIEKLIEEINLALNP
jgi:hypothetical protein